MQISPGVRDEIEHRGSGVEKVAEEADYFKQIARLKRLTLGLCGEHACKTQIEMCQAVTQVGLAPDYVSAIVWLESNSEKEHIYGTRLSGVERVYRVRTRQDGKYDVDYFEDFPDEPDD
jgi:hypothetical protein